MMNIVHGFMKKLLGILVLGFLFSGNANAGVNEPGSGPIAAIENVKKRHYEHLAKVKEKNQHLIHYVTTSESGSWEGWALHAKKINKRSHKKAYKKCMEYAADFTQEDCFLFAIDDKIVWNLDGPAKPKESESAEAKAEQEKQAQIEKKQGRFFEDKPDVNDDFQIHFIYFLGKNSKDKERDLNGWIEKEVKKIDDLFFKMTGNKQRFKFDYREDSKLDISFVRMDREANKKEGWNVNYPDYFLQKNGFNNPRKMYFSFVEAKHSDGGMMGPHHGYLFIKSVGKHTSGVGVHELLHGLGFAMPCTKGVTRGAHLNSGILGPDLQLKLGKAIYEHGDPTCPDLKDSVYLTPTSETPFDPLQIACALGQKVRGNPPGKYEIPARYTHKKLLKGRKNEWCTYKLTEYADERWFKKWKK